MQGPTIAELFDHSLDLPSILPLVWKGDFLLVTLDDRLHQISLRKHEHSLIGCMLFKTSLKQLPTIDQHKAALNNSRLIVGSWSFIPFGKGYFNVQAEILQREIVSFTRDHGSWSSARCACNDGPQSSICTVPIPYC